MTILPSADRVMAYAGTLNSKPIKNRRGENENDEVDWFYDDHDHAEPWCAIHECFVFNHFPGMLDSVGGKNALAAGWEHRAPTHGKWFPKHAAKEAVAGDVMEMDFNHNGSADHTEFFVRRVDSDHFVARGGNVGGDNAADNVRAYADVYGFFRPKYGPVDHTVYPGVLYWYRKSKPMQRSGYVTQIQKWLDGWGFLKAVDEDGVYGPKTANAVKKFQDAHMPKGSDDAKVGPKTWAALKKPVPKKD